MICMPAQCLCQPGSTGADGRAARAKRVAALGNRSSGLGAIALAIRLAGEA